MIFWSVFQCRGEGAEEGENQRIKIRNADRTWAVLVCSHTCTGQTLPSSCFLFCSFKLGLFSAILCWVIFLVRLLSLTSILSFQLNLREEFMWDMELLKAAVEKLSKRGKGRILIPCERQAATVKSISESSAGYFVHGHFTCPQQ